MTHVHVYAGNPLDRGERERRDEEWIARTAQDSESKVLPLRDLNILVSGASPLALAWRSPEDLSRAGITPTPILLGLLDGVAHFAADVSPFEAAGDLERGSVRFQDARAAAAHVSAPDAGIVAQARAQINWHNRHGFCSVCGERTVMARGGQVRKCPGCHAEQFPRTDPVVIAIISDGDRCLLGQSVGRLAASKMYSALAGFMDQGESIEEAVAREVMEEAGIQVTNVRYHSSQPWPFPSSLMIGCHADAATTEIAKDDVEMTEVRWFNRAEVLLALEGKSETLSVPGPFAIAHHLIGAWAQGEV